MFILENRFGNDGYAFWFKLLEALGSSEGHYYDCRNAAGREFLAAKTRLIWDTCQQILDLLASLDAIDPELWSQQVIWCEKFTLRISAAYRKRLDKIPQKPSLDGIPSGGNTNQNGFPAAETDKGKETKGKEKDILPPDGGSPHPSLKLGSEPAIEPTTFVSIFLQDETKYNITENMVADYQELYKALNVRQSLMECARYFNIDYPEKRNQYVRTLKGRVTKWLRRDLNKGQNLLQTGQQKQEIKKDKYPKSVQCDFCEMNFKLRNDLDICPDCKELYFKKLADGTFTRRYREKVSDKEAQALIDKTTERIGAGAKDGER